jgi:hypothetical protein
MAENKIRKKVITKKNNSPTPTVQHHSRSNGISVITGMQGVGKSHNLNERMKEYAVKHKRPVIVYDVNDEYSDYPHIRWDEVSKLKTPSVFRVLPYKIKRSGKKKEIEAFDIEELRNGFFYLLENFRNGCLVLDDFNSYTITTRKTNILSTLTRARHHGLDIIIVLQELGKVTKDLFANSSYFVLHKQTTSLDIEKKKITNFPLFKIAENIVNNQFYVVESLNELGHFKSEDEYKKFRSFYVEIDVKKNKIYGCPDKQKFLAGIVKYLKISDKNREVFEYMEENDMPAKNKEQYQKALDIVAKRYFSYYPYSLK